MEAIEISKPLPPLEYEVWSDLQRLSLERNLIGLFISGHPLDAYYVILQNICNLTFPELEDLEPFSGKEVMMGGCVTNVREGITKNNKPFGIVRLEDYGGSGELALFGENWARWRGYLNPGNALFITAKVEPRRWDPSKFDVNIGRVEFLEDVKDRLVERITISTRLDMLDEPTVESLSEIINESPGSTIHTFNVKDIENEMRSNTESKHRIRVTKKLLNFISSSEAFEYKIN